MTAQLTSRPKHCSRQKSMSCISPQTKTSSTITSLWGEIIIRQCAKWTILFVWQQSKNHKSCVTVQKIKLSFGRCPRTSICQNKWILFSKYINNETTYDPWMKWKKGNIDKEVWNLNRHKRDNHSNFTFGQKNEKKKTTKKHQWLLAEEIMALSQTARLRYEENNLQRCWSSSNSNV